jgi:hypothetical protein
MIAFDSSGTAYPDSITTPLRSKGLGFGLSCSCTLKYASSRGRGNVLIPKGFPRSAGRVESRLLGFPCFPYSVISIACVGNAFHKVTITAKARFGNRNHLSEMATSRPSGKDPGCRRYRSPIKTYAARDKGKTPASHYP